MTQRLQALGTLFLTLAALNACGTAGTSPQASQEVKGQLSLASSAFAAGDTIPIQYTCQGQDVSPSLSWSEPPPGTQSFALIFDDPDAPGGTWIHWVLFNLPAGLRSLPEADASGPAPGGVSGNNSWRRLGYGGPCPPPGPAHSYFFRLYALDTMLDLSPGASQKDLKQAMGGHILAQGELMGRYGTTPKIL